MFNLVIRKTKGAKWLLRPAFHSGRVFIYGGLFITACVLCADGSRSIVVLVILDFFVIYLNVLSVMDIGAAICIFFTFIPLVVLMPINLVIAIFAAIGRKCCKPVC
jgi:hypothetical protein